MTDPISATGRSARETGGLTRLADEDFRRLFHSAPIGIFRCAPDTLIGVNPALTEMLGWDCADNLCEDRAYCLDFLARCGFERECPDKLPAAADDGGRVEFRRRDGSTFAAKLTLTPVDDAGGARRGYEGFVEDLTEKDATTRELREAQEMAMRGQLAGGIAHDFNNILSATLIHLGLLLQDPEIPPGAKDGLRVMRGETERAADLTRQLLSFSRRHAVAALGPLELNKLIAALLPMLRRLARENILVVFLPAKEECWVRADAGLVEMLVMHLCLLSRRSMPQGGTLTLATYLVSEPGTTPLVCLTATQSRPVPQQAPARTGALIASWSETREEPGLRAMREIVTLHRGRIELPKLLDSPAPFRIFLPLASTAAVPAPLGEPDEVRGGDETILLVEDERYLRRTSSLCLRKLGYAVLEAGDDEEALKLWEKHQQKIDVIFTDFLLPGSSTGLELARRMEKDKPSLKIIVASGQGADFEETMVEAGAGIAHISKPYSAGELARALRHCLDRSEASRL